MDLVEVMEVRDGLIRKHGVYWCWRGLEIFPIRGELGCGQPANIFAVRGFSGHKRPVSSRISTIRSKTPPSPEGPYP